MKQIVLSKPARDAAVDQIKRHVAAELDREIGALEAELLLDFFSERIGPYYYNQGLNDAQAMLARSIDDISERIYGLEQPVADR